MKRNISDLIVFLAADGSQIEIRMLAEASGDPLLIRQFNSGQDIHCLVGNALTGWPIEQIAKDKEVRRSVKEFHFSIVYGVGKQKMYEHLRSKGVKITRKQAESYYDNYFRTYKGVRRYIVKCRKQAEDLGYVETLFGPFRRSIYQKEEGRGSYYLNQAINTPIQGSAHQLILMAMALVDLKPRTYNLLREPVMEVHDELVFYVRFGDLVEAYQQIKQLLEKEVVRYAWRHFHRKMRVPFLAEVEFGFTRGTQVEYQGEPLEEALMKWRKKYNEVSALPLTSLLPKRNPPTNSV